MKSRKIHFEKYELVENSRTHILYRKKLCFDYIIAQIKIKNLKFRNNPF